MRSFLISVLEIVEIAVVAVAAVFLIRGFLVQPFLVSGSSMIPNFSDGDYLLVDQVTYRFRAPERGEVVVFRPPEDSSTYFIKRIIGLPGETIKIGGGGVMVSGGGSDDGAILEESYLPSFYTTSGDREFVLGEDEYLLLGDNRSYSFDSRSWGALEKEKIVGLVRLRLWPLGNVQAFAAPAY